MERYRNYRLKCPCCGQLTWSSRFYADYNLEIYIQKAIHGVGGRLTGVRLVPVTMDHEFIEEFKPHFKQMFLKMSIIGLVDLEYLRGTALRQGFTVRPRPSLKAVVPRSMPTEIEIQPKYKTGR